MQPRSWNPFFELIQQQQNRMSRLLEEGLGSTAMTSVTMPATDVYEQAGKLIVEVALPKFEEKDIEVNLSGDGLEIKAEHKEQKEEQDKDRKYIMRESSLGSFYRYINLPSGANTDEAKASFKNGILRVEVPRQERPQSKKLELSPSQED